MARPTKDELAQWKQNAVTKEYFNALKQQQIEIARTLAGGGSLTGGLTTCETTARLVGRVEGLEDALTVELYTEEDE